ncbi:MAG: hypothetical protein ACYST3_09105 [Planctomycetota bacterium]
MDFLFKTEVLERDVAEPYARLFEKCPHALAQQSLQWSDIISPLSPDKPYFIVVRQKNSPDVIGGLPLYYFRGSMGGILTSVPHAGPLGGVLVRNDLSNDLIKNVYNALINEVILLAEKNRCIALTIITHPFLQDADLYKSLAQPNYVFSNFTQLIDINSILTEAGRYNTGKSRYNNYINKNLSKARRADITVRWGDNRDFLSWYPIHCKRHGELGKDPLPKPLLEGILKRMKPVNMGGLAVIQRKDKIIGGCMYIWNKLTVDAFIMSSDSDYFEYGINHAVTDFAVKYFKEQGLKFFNWQSCDRSSGVYEFKKRWGSFEKDYEFLTWTFPGFERVFAEGKDSVFKAYRWHYLAPYDAIEKRMTHGVFEK